MSRGHTRPLTCCDRDCAVVNDCQVGGRQCDDCELWFCISDLTRTDDGKDLCDDCRAAREQEESEDDTEGSEQGPAQAAQGQTS